MNKATQIETGWLIEHYSVNPYRWLRCTITYTDRPKAILFWDEDASVALRFARKEDAEAFAYLHPEYCILTRITEHQFGA